MQFLVIPNSCFSVMFVDPEYFYFTNKTTVTFNLPQFDVDIPLHGEWVPLNFTVPIEFEDSNPSNIT